MDVGLFFVIVIVRIVYCYIYYFFVELICFDGMYMVFLLFKYDDVDLVGIEGKFWNDVLDEYFCEWIRVEMVDF